MIGGAGRVRWTWSGVSGSVMIELSRDGGVTWKTIVSSTANDGSHNWTVAGAKTRHARVRVTSLSQLAVTDTSNADFRIR